MPCSRCVYNTFETGFIECLDCDEKNSAFKLKEEDGNGKQNKIDFINNPPHYTTGSIETIDYIFDTISDPESFCAGNILKYVSRYKHKNGIEDLQKAEYYLKKLIGLMED
jgi:hypothetical protein